MTARIHSVAVVAVAPDRCWPAGIGPSLQPVFVVWDDATTPADALARIELTGALTVCLGPDLPEQAALEVGRWIDEHQPDMSVVLVRTPSPELWVAAAHVGIRDVVAPDAPADDLAAALTAAAEHSERVHRLRAGDPATGSRGKVIVVVSPKGGSGKTMVATNLAVLLASSHVGDTVLVDFDGQFGDVASVMGLVPAHTVGHLAALPDFDSATLKVFLTRHDRSGLFVLAGADSPEEGEAVTDRLCATIIQMLAADFAHVVVDTAAGLDERTLASIECATDCVMLAGMEVAGVRNLVKEVDALDRAGLVGAQRHFVLNRAGTKVGLDVDDIEAALDMKVRAAIPSSRLVPTAMNRGRVMALEYPDSPVVAELQVLAGQLTTHPVGAPPERVRPDSGSKRGRSLWRR